MAMQKARLAKKMSQADVAKQINEKATVINDYESGRAIPNPQIIQKLQRVLGVKLPRAQKPTESRDHLEEQAVNVNGTQTLLNNDLQSSWHT